MSPIIEDDFVVPSSSRKKRKVIEDGEPSTPSPDTNRRGIYTLRLL